jgi:hypothetical protein
MAAVLGGSITYSRSHLGGARFSLVLPLAPSRIDARLLELVGADADR